MRNHTDMSCLQEAVYQDGRRKERGSKLGLFWGANLAGLGRKQHLRKVLMQTVSSQGSFLSAWIELWPSQTHMLYK